MSENYNARQALILELLQQTYNNGLASLKGAILINGGAAVATFALLQTVWLQKTSTDEKLYTTLGIYGFILGMLLAVIGIVCLHCLMRKNSQECLEEDLFAESNNDIDSSDTTATIKRNILQGIKPYHITTIIFTALSSMVFIIGVAYIVQAFASSLNRLDNDTSIPTEYNEIVCKKGQTYLPVLDRESRSSPQALPDFWRLSSSENASTAIGMQEFTGNKRLIISTRSRTSPVFSNPEISL